MPISAARLGFWRQPPPPPAPIFYNSGFEQNFTSWTLVNERIFLNGGSLILGYPTPNDPFTAPSNLQGTSPGYPATISEFTTTISTSTSVPVGGETRSILMSSYGIVDPAGTIVYGPGFYSEFPVIAEVGDTITFQYRAVSNVNSGLSDAYKVFAYFLNSSNGNTITLLNAWSANGGTDTGWLTYTRTIQPGEQGNWHFVFINGTWDSTFGTVVGAQFYLDNVKLVKA